MKFEKIIKCLFTAAIIIFVIASAIFASTANAAVSETYSSVCGELISAKTEHSVFSENVSETDSSSTAGNGFHELLLNIDLSNFVNDFESYAESIKSVFEILKKLFGNTSYANA